MLFFGRYLDFSEFNTSKVKNMAHLFCGCYSLSDLNISNFNTGNVTDMNSMFSGCSVLKSIIFKEIFKTEKVTNMCDMFKGCHSLTSLNLESFNIRLI